MSTAHTPHVPQAHPTRGGLIPNEIAIGILLAVIGLVVAVAYVVPDAAPYMPLVVGLTCVALFALTREYGFGVSAGIVTGVGVGVALTGVVPEEWVGPTILLSLAGGFVGAWLLGLAAVPSAAHAWPLVPAAILAAIGVLLATGREEALLYVQLAVAAVLVGAGIWIVARYLRATR
jgi:hypothetical protein